MAHVGLIQSGSIGDLIIAMPIADEFLARGHRVFWPVHERFAAMMRAVKPEVDFIAVPSDAPDPDLEWPAQALRDAGCERVFTLYSFVDTRKPLDALARSLKFDEYKYAAAGVPFARKWHLRLTRDLARERALHASLGVTGPYICSHLTGSTFAVSSPLPPEFTAGHQVIDVRPLTDSVFDWIYTLEHAAKLVLLDSCFANLVEQLNLPNEKYLLLRSRVHSTPVYKNGWTFVPVARHDQPPPR